jgi:hypothetical protein
MGDSQLASISFSGSEDKSATELGGAIPLVVNAIPDSSGAVRRRPGVTPWDGFDDATFPYDYNVANAAIIGMMPFGDVLVFVTGARELYALTPGGVVQALSTRGAEGTLLAGAARPSMIAGRRLMVVAGGAQIQTWDGASLQSRRLLNTGDGVDPAPSYPPPDAAFLSAIAQRLVACPPGISGQIWWSGPLENYENWDAALGGASYIQAAAKPDPIVAMLDNTNEVFAFGAETLQVFAPAALAVDVNDPNVLLDFAPSRTMNLGTVSPYSVVAIDDMFAMLDRQRRIVITDGRTFKDVSVPVAQILRDLTSITDMWGFRMRFGRFDCLIWMFPTDGFGLIYDANTSKWAEWRSYKWPTTTSPNTPPTITCAYNWAEKSLFLVGTSDGKIAQLDDLASTDGWSGSFAPIMVELVSGFTDHGSTSQKHCRTLMLKFKRTWAALPATSPGLSPSGHVRISKRDNQGTWHIVKDIELSTNPNPCVQLRSLGVYRTRQWKVEYTGQDEIQLVSAQEEFEILGA